MHFSQLVISCFVISLATISSANGQEYLWTAGTGDWHDPSSWMEFTDTGQPLPGGDALVLMGFPNEGDVRWTDATGNVAIQAMDFSGDFTLKNLSSNPYSLNVQQAIAFLDGTLSTDGIDVNAGSLVLGIDTFVESNLRFRNRDRASFNLLLNNGVVETTDGALTSIFGLSAGLGSFQGMGEVRFEDQLRFGTDQAAEIIFGGDVTLIESSDLVINVEDRLNFDRMLIDGDLHIGNARLTLEDINEATFSHGDEIVFAEIDGSVFGEFGGLSEGRVAAVFGGASLTISYELGDGNDIGLVLVTVPEPGSLSAILCFGLAIATRRKRHC